MAFKFACSPSRDTSWSRIRQAQPTSFNAGRLISIDPIHASLSSSCSPNGSENASTDSTCFPSKNTENTTLSKDDGAEENMREAVSMITPLNGMSLQGRGAKVVRKVREFKAEQHPRFRIDNASSSVLKLISELETVIQ
jgi:hypothetical protein